MHRDALDDRMDPLEAIHRGRTGLRPTMSRCRESGGESTACTCSGSFQSTLVGASDGGCGFVNQWLCLFSVYSLLMLCGSINQVARNLALSLIKNRYNFD